MLYLGRNEKALYGRGRYSQSAHTHKIVYKVKQSPLVQAVFSWDVPCLEREGGRTGCQAGGLKLQD